MGGTTDDSSRTVEWRQISPAGIASPIYQRVPYLELKLEHPGLEPNGHGDRFFPDAVPYEFDDGQRVFYWRPALAPSTDDPSRWKLACATTHELAGADAFPADGPSLFTEGASGTTIIVGGTVAGDATTSRVASYPSPELTVDGRSDTGIELTVNGTEYSVSVGERRRIRLEERRVHPVDRGSGATTVTPELVVRYPGPRELHHPARGATYRLFPSFDLGLDEIPNPLPIPTTADELDEAALATQLGVDLSRRPYPERVLWQAFAYTAFDPHRDAVPKLTRLGTDHIVLRMENYRTG
ncbi:MAG: hypothetical protein ACI8XM_000105 [Haloarculaceae archaeon]|jgi:hypothetical protein